MLARTKKILLLGSDDITLQITVIYLFGRNGHAAVFDKNKLAVVSFDRSANVETITAIWHWHAPIPGRRNESAVDLWSMYRAACNIEDIPCSHYLRRVKLGFECF